MRGLTQETTHGEAQMVGAFLLKPHVPRVIVGELHDQRALVLGQQRGDLLHELLLALDIDRREELVFVNRLQQLLVLVLALIFNVRKGGNEPALAIKVELGCALTREFE